MYGYGEEDFENAKFSVHPNGEYAARLYPTETDPWFTNSEDALTDEYMAENGWIPAPKDQYISHSDYLTFTQKCGEQFRAGFEGALILFDIPIIYGTANAKRISEAIELSAKEVGLGHLTSTEIENLAEAMDKHGVKYDR